MLLQPGHTYERYTVEALLGQGGLAEVYRVRHTLLGTSHALKVLTVPSTRIRERLLQEGTIQARLRHPNLVAVTDVIEVDGAPALVMELIEGPTLEQRLAQGPLDLLDLDAFGRAILSGVAAAHAQGMVHRDLKPANVLLAPEGRRFIPKVADFGLAKLLGDEPSVGHTRTGAVMGTPLYMAPEQVKDAKHVDARADVFALGAILYEMATGRKAFEGGDVADILQRVRDVRCVPIERLRDDLPPAFLAVVRAALVQDPNGRPDDARALLALWTPPAPLQAPLPLPGTFGEPDPYEAHHSAKRGTSAGPPGSVPPTRADSLDEEDAPRRRWLAVALFVAATATAALIAWRPWATAPVLPPEAVAAPEAEPATAAPVPPRRAAKAEVPPAVTGTLRVRSLPVASVRLDGKSVGAATPFERVVAVGTHSVLLTDPATGQKMTLKALVQENQPAELCWDFAAHTFCP